MKTPYLAAGLDYQGRHPEAMDAHIEWLQAYTWIQLDGTIDFRAPRIRPQGLPIAPAEIDRMALCTAEAPEAAHAACEHGMDMPAVRRRRELSGAEGLIIGVVIGMVAWLVISGVLVAMRVTS
jgi:hypothetical protein